MTSDQTGSARLVAVVVTHNRLAKLKTGMAALLAQYCHGVVVVDNCSDDGTAEWLAEVARRDARLDVLRLERNRGGAGGFEAGFRRALDRHDPEWVVCFDDDAYPQPDALLSFLASDLDGIDAVAAAVYYPDGHICEMNRPSRNPFWHWRLFLRTLLGGRRGFHLDDSAYDGRHPVPVDATSFVGFFVRRSMVERVGLPEGRLFIYGDDVLYSLNVARSGGRIRFLPWVCFTHDCSTLNHGSRVHTPLWKAYYTYRNGLRVYHTAAGWLFWLFVPLKLARWLLDARLYSSPRLYLRVLGLAVADAVRGRYDRSHDTVVSLSRQER